MKLLERYIKLLVEQEFKTKRAQKLSFEVIEDSEGENRGWTVHHIEAFIDGKSVGYLKASYIPRERFEKRYRHFIDYADKVGGHHLGVEGKNWEDLSLKEQVASLNRHFWSWSSEHLSEEQINSMSDAELVKVQSKLLKMAERKWGEEFVKFENFHVDKPLVDYIRVGRSQRRQRIGAALYEYAARWLAKKGFKLYASGIQTDPAKESWKWLAQNKGANIGTEKSPYNKPRIYLSYL